MIKKIKSLTRREQIFSIIIGFIFIILIFALINSFLMSWQEESQNDYFENQTLLIKVKRVVDLKDQDKGLKDLPAANLSSIVSSYARSFNLTIDRLQPLSESEVSVTINNSDFVSLFNWLRDLEEKRGVFPSKVSIRRNPSNVADPGVKAQIVLKVN